MKKYKKAMKQTYEAYVRASIETVSRDLLRKNPASGSLECKGVLAKAGSFQEHASLVRRTVKFIQHRYGIVAAAAMLAVFQAGEFRFYEPAWTEFDMPSVETALAGYKKARKDLSRNTVAWTLTYRDMNNRGTAWLA